MLELPGDMAGAFYGAVGACESRAAAAETERLLTAGTMPGEGLGLDHYREAVAWHQVGRIHDAELAAIGLLARLELETRATTGRKVLQKLGAPEVASTRAHLGHQRLPPLLEMLVHHRLRGIKGMARLALLGWSVGRYPGILAMGKVTTRELLDAQAAGRRYVGVGLPEAGFAGVDAAYPGGFTHHDLCHLAKFRGALDDDTVYAGQVGFYVALQSLVLVEPTLLDERPDLPPGMDLSVVASDTNGDVRLLLTLFLARLLAQKGARPEERSPIVARYLALLGLAEGEAAAAAGIYDDRRGEFLQTVGPYFETRGYLITSSLTNASAW